MGKYYRQQIVLSSRDSGFLDPEKQSAPPQTVCAQTSLRQGAFMRGS
jgi:hypothetical protein